MSPVDPYQAYVIAPIVKGGFRYVVGLVFRPATMRVGYTTNCKMFLDSFFSLCGDLLDVARGVSFEKALWHLSLHLAASNLDLSGPVDSQPMSMGP